QTAFWIDKRFDLHPDTPSVLTLPRRALQDCALDPLFHHSSPSPLPPKPRLQLLFSPALARSRDESREVPRPWGSSSRADCETGRGCFLGCQTGWQRGAWVPLACGHNPVTAAP